jgi:N-acylneuraminate cytidylyltransferase
MILGVIPARGGSKGVQRKNIREIHGKPLIAWTIEAAQASRLLDRFVVSTEDREIASIANKWGADVIERPTELATDDAATLAVMQHVIGAIPADVIVLLQATSPIRNPGLIDRCIQRFIECEADSLATGFICKYKAYGQNSLRRQDSAGFFYDDGNIYVMKANMVRNGDQFGKRHEHVLLDREQNVEIDDEFDFWLAEQILIRRDASR